MLLIEVEDLTNEFWRFVERWANRENATVGKQGNPGDGTSIDRDEPFVIRWPWNWTSCGITAESGKQLIVQRISCDTDGWVVKSNNEKDYPTFLHIIQPVEILDIQVRASLILFILINLHLSCYHFDMSRHLSCYLEGVSWFVHEINLNSEIKCNYQHNNLTIVLWHWLLCYSYLKVFSWHKWLSGSWWCWNKLYWLWRRQ